MGRKGKSGGTTYKALVVIQAEDSGDLTVVIGR